MTQPEIIQNLKDNNPYPEKLFPQPSDKNYEDMRLAFLAANMSPDAFFGTLGRKVWNNCVDELTKLNEQSTPPASGEEWIRILELAEMELVAMYKRLGINGSNVLYMITQKLKLHVQEVDKRG